MSGGLMNRQSEMSPEGKARLVTGPAGLSLPLEVRVHGRGGQGGVTCAKLIAILYSQMGFSVQTFGDYGSERTGAPIAAYARVDRAPIINRNKVYSPDHLLVLDEGLLGPQVLSGAAQGALLLLNSRMTLAGFDGRFPHCRLGVVDATSIAREHGIGSASLVIVNTTILGAYVRMLGMQLEVLERAYASLGLGEDFVAARHAFDAVEMRDVLDFEPEVVAPAPPPPVGPLTSHCVDVPPTLLTGAWSTQTPVYRSREAPCNVACPAGNDVVGFIEALRTAGADAALAILLRTQPLPSVCGRVCPAPCMQVCNRRVFDGAVNIRSLERWIADQATVLPVRQKAERPRRVAVVGGGPAGLSAAYHLALRGHEVSLFEAASRLGGVLQSGIPAFRLPREVLQRDLDRILSLGVQVHPRSRLGAGDLRRLGDTYEATIVCTGFGAENDLIVPGGDLGGVEQGLAFLERTARAPEAVSGRVLVVGGGNTAIDCARTALRCGAASVKLVYRRAREDMPAIIDEIEEAEAEGLGVLVHRQPVAFVGENRVTAAVLAEMEEGAPDASGRRRPVATDRTMTLACERVLLALGQKQELDLLPDGWERRGDRAWQGEQPLAVWFAGDCATADGTVAHAIGTGRRAALAALAALGAAVEKQQPPTGAPVAPAEIRFSHFDVMPPHRDRQLPPATRMQNFAESNQGLGGPEEAGRCFSCGHCTLCDTCLVYCPESVIHRTESGYRIDEDYCKGCGMCVAECPRNAMEMREKGG